MATYNGNGLFSSGGSSAYRLYVTVETTPVTGGTQLYVTSYADFFYDAGGAISPAYSSSGSRGYSVPGGRRTSVTGTLLESGSATWSYDFRSSDQQDVWGGFNRFIPSSYGSSTTVTITASGSGSTFLGNASVTVSVPLIVNYNYSIDYNANGGSGTTPSTIATSSSTSYTLSVASSQYSRSGYTFTGWNTSSGGGGTSYSPGQSITLSSGSPTIDLYAQWAAQATITFDYQGGSGSPSSRTINSGDAIGSLPSASLGTYNFMGWYYGVNGSGGQVSQFTTFSSNDTLYAYYESIVAFNANGGTGGTTVYVPKGTSINPTSYSAGTRSGYTFTGWSPYNYTFTPTGYTTLTAQWTALSVSWSDTTLSTTARKGVSYSDTISASYVNSWNDGILPSKNISFVQGTSTTGLSTSTVTGTPNDYGPLTFTLTPSNIDGVAGAAYTYTINIADEQIVWADQTIVNSLVVQGESYSDSVSVESGPTVTYSLLSGSLPDGVTLNSSTGTIAGTVSASATPGVYNFVVRATNGTGETEDTGTLSVTVEAAGGYVKVWNGTQWLEGTAYVRAAGTWNEGTVKLRASGTWNDSFSS